MSTSVTASKRRPRIVTIVWGVVVLAIAALILVGEFTTLSIDPVIVSLGVLVGIGLALIAGGIVSLRSRTTEDDHPTDHDY